MNGINSSPNATVINSQAQQLDKLKKNPQYAALVNLIDSVGEQVATLDGKIDKTLALIANNATQINLQTTAPDPIEAPDDRMMSRLCLVIDAQQQLILQKIDGLSAQQQLISKELSDRKIQKEAKEAEKQRIANLPYLERIDLEEKTVISKRRHELMSNIDFLLSNLQKYLITSSTMSTQALNVKLPQENLQNSFNDYDKQLAATLLAIPDIHARITQELGTLIGFSNTLTEEQQLYLDTTVEKGNQILLLANELPMLRSLLKDTLALLPDIREYAKKLTTSYHDIHQTKQNYQAPTVPTIADWEYLATYADEELQKLQEYQNQGLQLEKGVLLLISKLAPLSTNENASNKLFSYLPETEKTNQEDWKAMVAKIDTERNLTKTAIINAWKGAFIQFYSYNDQIHHIVNSVEVKNFVRKAWLTVSGATASFTPSFFSTPPSEKLKSDMEKLTIKIKDPVALV